MSDSKTIKQQRDQFLAFAFASADLFIEVSADGKIIFALGAAKCMTGIKDQELLDKKWLELFSSYDQAELKELHKTAKPGQRRGPVLVDLNEHIAKRKAIFTGIKMPDNENFYITLGLSNMVMSKIANLSPTKNKPISTPEEFLDESLEIFDFARSIGQDVDITVFDFSPTETIREELGPENWGGFTQTIAEFLQSNSINGQGAAEIGDGRYALIHDPDLKQEALTTGFKAIAEEIEALTTDFDVSAHTVHADLPNIPSRDAEKAMSYTLGAFEDKGSDIKITTLKEGIKKYALGNKTKQKQLADYIDRVDFSLLFQPVLDIEKNEVAHYEIVTRFPNGRTSEWINFAEDMGLIAEFDIALCERAINHISFKAGGSSSEFSMNISAKSLENDTFLERIDEQLQKGTSINNRLRFEITQSQHIESIDRLSAFIAKIQEHGFEVMLDDFGNAGPVFNLMPELNISAVKIHRQYIRNIPGSPRDESVIEDIIKNCRKIGTIPIAKGIETEKQAQRITDLGIKLGQGYLFGDPIESPSYTPPQK